MTPDEKGIRDFLRWLFPLGFSGELELAWTAPGSSAPIYAAHFDYESLDGMAAMATVMNSEGANCYFTPVSMVPGLGDRRCTNADLAATQVLWCDIDRKGREEPVRFDVVKPAVAVTTNPELRNTHAYFRLSRPLTDGAEVARLNKRIAAAVPHGDSASTNGARVLRVPGCVRWPTEDKPGEPHVIGARWFGRESYSVAQIEQAFPAPAGNGRRDYGINGIGSRDWSQLLADAIEEGGRNSTIAKMYGYLLSRRVDPCFARDLILAANGAYCDPPLDGAEVEAVCENVAAAELQKGDSS